MRTRIGCVVAALGLLWLPGTAAAEKEKGNNKSQGNSGEEKSVNLPKALAEAVKTKFPGARVVGIGREDEDGATVYEVTLRTGAVTLGATLTAKGQVVKVRVKPAEAKASREDDEDDDKERKGKSASPRGEQKGQHEDGDKKAAKPSEKKKGSGEGDEKKSEKPKKKGDEREDGDKKVEKSKKKSDEREDGEKKGKRKEKGDRD